MPPADQLESENPSMNTEPMPTPESHTSYICTSLQGGREGTVLEREVWPGHPSLSMAGAAMPSAVWFCCMFWSHSWELSPESVFHPANEPGSYLQHLINPFVFKGTAMDSKFQSVRVSAYS